jgi:transposase-like protein
MEDSPLPLEKWLAAYWMEANCKNSISSWEVHRALGVTQKTAWFMLHRIRFALKQGSMAKMGATGTPVEADETFIGGLAKNMHAKRRKLKITGGGAKDKTAVVGLLERHSGQKHSTVRAEVLKGHVNKASLYPVIHKHVQPGAQLMTDTHAGYAGLDGEYIHKFIDHAEKYVDGIVHTNGIENFWSLFKRCIKGTHISVAPVHLLAYVDSEAFRFNHRKTNDGARFLAVANSISGKRLMYNTLIGHDGSEGYTSAVK